MDSMLTEYRLAQADRQRMMRFLLLLEEIETGGPRWTATRGLRRLFEILENRTASEFIATGTTFFWSNVARTLDALRTGDDRAGQLADYTLRSAIDSYFNWLKEGDQFDLDASDPLFVLPRLGVAIKVGDNPVTLYRRAGDALDVEYDGRQVTVTAADVPAGMRLGGGPVPGPHGGRIVLASCPTLFDTTCLDKIVPSPRCGDEVFAEMVAKSLEMIDAVDPELSQQVDRLIDWYVPIHTPGPSVHNSFSVKNLRGVIFLSEAYDDIRIAEALVHEFHHNELYTVQESLDLHHDRSGEVFYSPWRPDPRPLDGLLHALYVFSGVAGFIRGAERLPALESLEVQMRGRREHVVSQLRVGLAQVPRSALTGDGQAMIEAVEAEVRQQERELGMDGRLPAQTVRHFEDWRAEHPDLIGRVVIPERAGA